MEDEMQLNKLALALVFCLGYITSDILNEINFSLISPVKADVAGMDYYDLRTSSSLITTFLLQRLPQYNF